MSGVPPRLQKTMTCHPNFCVPLLFQNHHGKQCKRQTYVFFASELYYITRTQLSSFSLPNLQCTKPRPAAGTDAQNPNTSTAVRCAGQFFMPGACVSFLLPLLPKRQSKSRWTSRMHSPSFSPDSSTVSSCMCVCVRRPNSRNEGHDRTWLSPKPRILVSMRGWRGERMSRFRHTWCVWPLGCNYFE
jgi:hypothetical protein